MSDYDDVSVGGVCTGRGRVMSGRISVRSAGHHALFDDHFQLKMQRSRNASMHGTWKKS